MTIDVPKIGRLMRALDQISRVMRVRTSQRDALVAILLVCDDKKNTIHSR